MDDADPSRGEDDAPPAQDPAVPAAVPAGVLLRTPETWWDLPLAERTRHRAVADLVDARIAAEPTLAPRRNELVAVLRRTARDAAKQGAVLCRSLTAGDERAAVSATLLVVLSGIPGSPDGVGGAAAAQALRASLTGELGRDRDAVNPEATVVGLPLAGASVRVRALRTVDVTLLGRPVQVLTLQYFVPVPNDGTAVLTFTSPSTGYAEQLVAVFDAVAASMAFLDATGEPIPPS